MDETRPDISKRLELVTNRIKYLKEELAILEPERLMLANLSNHYLAHRSDPIDDERKTMAIGDIGMIHPGKVINPKHGRSLQATILDELVESKTTDELYQLLPEFTGKQISNALWYLRKEHKIGTFGTGKTAKHYRRFSHEAISSESLD